MAWTVRFPGRKFNHGVLMGGAPGIGKDSILAPLIDAVGRHNTVTIDGSELNSDFNSHLAGAKLIVVNEIDFGDHKDRRAVAEKLKRVLAAPPDTLRVNEKNLRPYEIPNRVQVFGMTNHRYCLHTDGTGERRYLMLWCAAKIPEEHRESWDRWFDQYWTWLKGGGSARVLAFLRRRDLSHFSPGSKPPVTAWLEDVMSQSRDGLESWLLEQIAAGEGIFKHPVVTANDILDLLRTGLGAHWVSGEVTHPRLTRALRAVGAYQARVGFKRNRGWVIREDDRYQGDLTDSQNTAQVVRIENRLRKRELKKAMEDWL